MYYYILNGVTVAAELFGFLLMGTWEREKEAGRQIRVAHLLVKKRKNLSTPKPRAAVFNQADRD